MKKQKSRKRKHKYKSKYRAQKRIDISWSNMIKPIIIISILFVIILVIYIVTQIYTVDTVTIEGNIHYTNEEIVKISKLLREGRTYREIAMILDRDYTRLTRKINELELYRLKKINLKTLKMTSIDKLEYYNNKLNSYFNEKHTRNFF